MLPDQGSRQVRAHLDTIDVVQQRERFVDAGFREDRLQEVVDQEIDQNLDRAMVDLTAFFKPTLTVLDAYRILVRNGPQGGRVSDTKLVKTVVAGTDPVAVDAMGATFFDIRPQELLYLRLAQERGLGKFELEKVRIEKRKI